MTMKVAEYSRFDLSPSIHDCVGREDEAKAMQALPALEVKTSIAPAKLSVSHPG